jgi:two-component system sensor histidine kinase KdpD
MAKSGETFEARPDPEALLALTGAAGRGRLTIFLGAAPGVGKSFAMLTRARRVYADGADLVVGLVETHGRAETAALLDGLEVLPRRAIEYQGRTLDEFDLDAALARKPKIVVVDELAHSNAPGSRHPKRHQDVDELLDAGIDVWTALNVQHIESLSDVVAQITGTAVRERVPDVVVSRADDVLLVDLAPAELLERLKDGKVYVPDNARRAAEGFFRLGNLTALRELALRRTAARVDTQVVDYLKQNAIDAPWQSSERLLVCVGPDTLSEKVVRQAARMASGLNAPWICVSIERADQPLAASSVHRLDATLKLAADLGAETRRITASDFVDAILVLARRERVTQIVIGARQQGPAARLFKTSLTEALISRVPGLGVHVVTDIAAAAPRTPSLRPARGWLSRPLRTLGVGVGTVAGAAAIGYALDSIIDLPNVALLFLVAVLIAAVTAGYGAALLAAVLSALAYNFLFIHPVHTFIIAQPHEVVGFITFIAVAVLAGGMASRVSEQARTARERAAATQALYNFSRKLSATAKADDVVWAAVSHLQGVLRRNIAFLLPAGGEIVLSAAWPPETELGVADMTAARWAYEKKEIAGVGTGTLPNSAFQFRPLLGSGGVIAVVGLSEDGRPFEGGDEEVVLGAILDQTAIAIDRARLSRETLEQSAKLEGDRFRTALLSSVSHDLKTPLATITGAVTSLRQLGDKMKPQTRDDLLQSIEEEGERLNRFVANLLDMTRIEAGNVEARHDWVDVADVVRATVARVDKYFPGRKVETSVAADLPPIRGDSVLLGQVLFNLIDNALKYAGGEQVTVFARRDADALSISVTDLGKGIPLKDLERVFEKFFRRGKVDGRRPGTGLGLAIAKGFTEAMGGSIRAESPAVKRRGTRFTLRFPIEPAA